MLSVLTKIQTHISKRRCIWRGLYIYIRFSLTRDREFIVVFNKVLNYEIITVYICRRSSLNLPLVILKIIITKTKAVRNKLTIYCFIKTKDWPPPGPSEQCFEIFIVLPPRLKGKFLSKGKEKT